MSIGRAQAIAIRDGFLNDIGIDPAPRELPIIDAVLAEVAQSFIDLAASNLDKSDSVSTGELASALTFSVELQGDTYQLSVGYEKGSNAAKYWDFNNKGVQGVNKPGNAPNSPYKFRYMGVSPRHALTILKWYRHNGKGAANIHKDHPVSGLEKKRVTLRQSIQKTDDLSSLAYATAMKMKRDGLKPTNYFDNAAAETFGPELIEVLQVALGGEVTMRIRKYGDNI